jgi:uncharacterized protein (DUF433 family)
MDSFKRIMFNTNKMGGAACIRETRIPVSVIVTFIADGYSFEKIKEIYPDIEDEDIREALHYAASLTKEREIKIEKAS